MRNEIKKTLSLGALCSMAFFAASSAFAADKEIGGDYTLSGDYSYGNWTTGTADATAGDTTTVSYDNLTVGAGSLYTYTTATLTLDNLYLYGEEGSLAAFNQKVKDSVVNVTKNIVLDYGSWTQAAVNSMNVTGSVTMDNSSIFNVLAGTVTVGTNFTIGTDSTLSVGGGTTTSAGSLTVGGTMTLNDNAAVVAVYVSSANTTNIANLVMNDTSTYDMKVASLLYISSSLTMNGGTFTKTTGTLAFQQGSSIEINGGSFSSNATALYGSEGVISLVLDSVDLSGDDAVATILGSIDLGTVSFGSSAFWTIELDVSSVLDGYTADFTVDLSDLITMSSTETSKLDIILVDSDGNLYDDYTASLSGTNLSSATVSFTYAGAAVPEPSTYAMIFGVVALGFAAYRRRK